MTRYAILHNADLNAMVALPSTDVLTDQAFDKGWRILNQDVSYLELIYNWMASFNMELMDAVKFHLDYIADEEMTDEDVTYINACLQDQFFEGSTNGPDSDDEEIDVEFYGEDILDTVEEE